MGSLWTREFTGGLDTRRLPETTAGGVLLQATNGHINRGGEFEKRAAFVLYGTLPGGTFGLASAPNGLFVFSGASPPGGALPFGVVIQPLVSKLGVSAVAVTGYDIYAGNLVVAAYMGDGNTLDFYNGVVIDDFVDGRATASSTIATGYNQADGGMQTSLFGVAAGGVSLTGSPNVPWRISDAQTAADIVAQINNRTPITGYRAVSSGGTVQVVAVNIGSDSNEVVVNFFGSGGGTWTQSVVSMSGGRDAGTQPGSYVLTLGSKVYIASGPDLLFSGVDTPNSFNANTTGAGFIDMSSQASGSEQIYTLARYQKYLAIFSGRQTQIWYMDPDPDQNQQIQTLYNTGTFAPHSIVAFGDNDVFYLDETGIRSLRARDASNSATTDDVGVPIDTLIIAKLRGLSMEQRKQVRSVVEPTEGRVWISIIDTIYVFSYFAGAKVSAWSVYYPGVQVDELVAWNQRVFMRSGDNIFSYGGTGPELAYDDTVAIAQIPYQDAGKPTVSKDWNSVDVAVRGTWDVLVATDPNNPVQQEAVMTATQTTYNAPDSTMAQRSTHCSVIARTRGTGPATLSSIVLGYQDGSGARPDGGAP